LVRIFNSHLLRQLHWYTDRFFNWLKHRSLFRQVPRSFVQPIERGSEFLGEEVIAVARRGDFKKRSKIEETFSRLLISTPETKKNRDEFPACRCLHVGVKSPNTGRWWTLTFSVAIT